MNKRSSLSLWALVFFGAIAGGLRAAHPFLGTDPVGGKVAAVSLSGRVYWEFACKGPRDCWATSDGNFVFSYAGGVMEKLDDGRTLWEYVAESGADVSSCQPLPNGRCLVVENGPCRLVEVDTLGMVLKEMRLTPPHPDLQVEVSERFGAARQSADGHYLVCRKAEHVVEELDAGGNSLRRIPVQGDPRLAVRLPDGHLLIALGDGRKLQELDANLKVVWEVSEKDVAGNPLYSVTGFQRLPNGNTILCNDLGPDYVGQQAQVFEITRDKKIVWEYSDRTKFKTIAQFEVLDLPDDVMKGKVLR